MADPEKPNEFGRNMYKRGLIDAAQVICLGCEEAGRPVRGVDKTLRHGCCVCQAPSVIALLEEAGGWEAEWPSSPLSKQR